MKIVPGGGSKTHPSSLAAAIPYHLNQITNNDLRKKLSDFINVEHRLEFVAQVHGIEFINDSQSTNVNSTWFSLEMMEKPTVWIAGGVDKGNDYSQLIPLVKEKVKAIICIGKDDSKIIKTFSKEIEIANIMQVNSMSDAVAYSYRLAKKDEIVLLSPACASFDCFENYELRGSIFKECVRNIG